MNSHAQALLQDEMVRQQRLLDRLLGTLKRLNQERVKVAQQIELARKALADCQRVLDMLDDESSQEAKD